MPMGRQDNIAVPRNAIVCGDALAVLRDLPDESVQMCVTSPPYWGLRSYGTEPVIYGNHSGCEHDWRSGIKPAANGIVNSQMQGETLSEHSATRKPTTFETCALCGAWRGQLGLEPSPEMYVAHMVEIFREVRRTLRKDGTLWLNMGDCYVGGGKNRGNNSPISAKQASNAGAVGQCADHQKNLRPAEIGLKAKDLCGMPWRLAFALQADGWWLRSDIVWSKPNPMPESVTDRPTRAHEYVFLMTKAAHYFYDAEAIREPAKSPNTKMPDGWDTGPGAHGIIHREGREKGVSIRAPKLSGGRMGIEREMNVREYETICGANARSVWTISTTHWAEAHFATFAPELARRCILAGSPPQCCGVCGAPWVRIVKKSGGAIGAGIRSGGLEKGSPGAARGCAAHFRENAYRVDSLGFRPTCKHDDDGTGRGLVLDPFMGAGTVGVVCKELGRDYIGVELSEKYCDMAERRIRGEFGPVFKERAAMENAGQVTLL